MIISKYLQDAGGPKIPMKYGRVDASGPEQCPEEGRLPGMSAVGHLLFIYLVHHSNINIKQLKSLDNYVLPCLKNCTFGAGLCGARNLWIIVSILSDYIVVFTW